MSDPEISPTEPTTRAPVDVRADVRADAETHATINAVYRLESPKLIAGLAGPAAGLALVEALASEPSLQRYHPLGSARER